MPRYRQDPVTHKLIEVGNGQERDRSGAAIFGGFDPFVSPVDGTIIDSRRKLEEHNKRNNVVLANEFSNEYYERKARERARLFTGEHTREETYRRKQELYEIITRAENHGR